MVTGTGGGRARVGIPCQPHSTVRGPEASSPAVWLGGFLFAASAIFPSGCSFFSSRDDEKKEELKPTPLATLIRETGDCTNFLFKKSLGSLKSQISASREF